MYLVTGGGGFIGRHLACELARRGERVRVLDIQIDPEWQHDWPQVEWIQGDVRDAAVLAQVCQGVEVVFHHAAIASVPRSVADPELAHAVNCTGTLNVLMAAQAAGVRRVVFASSSAVYGNDPTSPKAESLPTVPLSPYGVQKLSAENYCRIWPSLYALETVALRYFNVYGPGQDPEGDYAAVIPKFASLIAAGRAPTIFGDGQQSRDFIFVQDVVAINILAAHAPQAVGQVLNVGTGTRTTLLELVNVLSIIAGQAVMPVYTPERRGDVRESLANISRLQAILGYKPQTRFADGLRATYATFSRPGEVSI